MKNIPTFEAFVNESHMNEAKDFKSTKDFEDFLEEIDGMPEVRIKRIMGNKYIDTPGGYRDEADDYDNDITEYMIANMGKKEFEKLKAYWETNVKESVDNESLINEALKFNDSNGNPNAISKEILGYVEKAFPAKVLAAIESVEPNGYNSMSSPGTVTNKGQARGVREYQTITLLINEGGIGKSKVSSITVGLVKRTSGPGTGYIAIKANNYQYGNPGHILLDSLPNYSVAKEFYDNASERLSELFNEVLAKHTS